MPDPADPPSGPPTRDRQVPDFLLMAAVVALSLVVGGIVLAVVPRPAAQAPLPPPAAAGPPPVALTSAPVVVTSSPSAAAATQSAGPDCAPDDAISDRLIPLPAGYLSHRMFQLAGLPDTEKIDRLWQRWATDMPEYLDAHGFLGCDYRVAEEGVTVALLVFNTATDARAVLAHAVLDLPAGPNAIAGGTFDFAEPGSQWVEGDRGGGFPEDTGLLARGRYFAFIILSPGDAGRRDLLQTLARQQYDLLPAA